MRTTMGAIRRQLRLVLEAAASGEQAVNAGFALYRQSDEGGRSYVLYDTGVARELAKSTDGFEEPIDRQDVERLIVAYVWAVPRQGMCNNAAEIKLSAARKGFGPLLYDIVMSDSAHGIMPDHGTGSSQKARAVWSRYATRSDVTAHAFDDANDPKTVPPDDDCELVNDKSAEFLDASYTGKGSPQAKTALADAHSEFCEALVDAGIKMSRFLDLLSDEAVAYFEKRYS